MPDTSRACLQCGTLFLPYRERHKFCSVPCERIAFRLRRKPKRAPAACLNCGMQFAPRAHNHRFCTYQCWDEARKNPTRPRRLCLCGVSFTPCSRTHKYCSPRCKDRLQPSRLAHRHRATLPRVLDCSYCGKRFKPSRRHRGRWVFCSHYCVHAVSAIRWRWRNSDDKTIALLCLVKRARKKLKDGHAPVKPVS